MSTSVHHVTEVNQRLCHQGKQICLKEITWDEFNGPTSLWRQRTSGEHWQARKNCSNNSTCSKSRHSPALSVVYQHTSSHIASSMSTILKHSTSIHISRASDMRT